MIKSSKASPRWIPAEILAVAGLAVACAIVGILAKFHRHIVGPVLSRLDSAFPVALHAHATPLLTKLMFLLTLIGSPIEVAAMLLVTLGILLAKKERGEAIGLVASEVGALLLNYLAKVLFHRHRPTFAWTFVHLNSPSFPSGHSMLGLISFGTVAYLLCRHYPSTAARTAIISFTALLVFGIGLSRIYLGAHFPSDVIAGFMVGAIWLAFVIVSTEVLHRIEPRVRPPESRAA